MRGHEQGLVTLDIHEYVEEGNQATFTETQRNELELRFKGCLMSKKSKRFDHVSNTLLKTLYSSAQFPNIAIKTHSY